MTTHGLSHTPEYHVWAQMKQRCLNPNNHSFKHYGARGITLCERWMDFRNFIDDMGRRPSKMHSIDRIDVDKGYYPENCRWSDRQKQNRNKRGFIHGQKRTTDMVLGAVPPYQAVSRRFIYKRIGVYPSRLRRRKSTVDRAISQLLDDGLLCVAGKNKKGNRLFLKVRSDDHGAPF